MLCFRLPRAWVFGSSKCSCLLSSKVILSQFLILLDPTLQSDFLSDFIHDMMSYGHWLFNFRLFFWDLAVQESVQSADICPHLTSPSPGGRISSGHISSNFTA